MNEYEQQIHDEILMERKNFENKKLQISHIPHIEEGFLNSLNLNLK